MIKKLTKIIAYFGILITISYIIYENIDLNIELIILNNKLPKIGIFTLIFSSILIGFLMSIPMYITLYIKYTKCKNKLDKKSYISSNK